MVPSRPSKGTQSNKVNKKDANLIKGCPYSFRYIEYLFVKTHLIDKCE